MSTPSEQLRDKMFTIRWMADLQMYKVSVPNFDGGEVVLLKDALAALAATRRAALMEAAEIADESDSFYTASAIRARAEEGE
jgi:hypothetical protein